MAKNTSRRRPVWNGPEVDGVTFSMLSRFLTDRERFRLRVVEGLDTAKRFEHRRDYGTMWHACEEAHANKPNDEDHWVRCLLECAKGFAAEFPMQREEVQHWYNVCRVQFPHYVRYWKGNEKKLNRTNLFAEKVFSVSYQLPDGTSVLLRGKFDRVDFYKRDKAVYLQENKTKSEVDQIKITRQLTFDLQTMLYQIALDKGGFCNHPIAGVLYNVVRRPLSGGAGSIRKHKPSKSNPQGETDQEFYARLSNVIEEGSDTFFFNWKCEVTKADRIKFAQQCLDPILMSLCKWWNYLKSCNFDEEAMWVNQDCSMPGDHYRFPYGLYNSMLEDRTGELDEYLSSGSMLGLEYNDRLFPELTG